MSEGGRAEFETELRRETSPGHSLHETEAMAVAVRRLRKEVVFWLPRQARWAWVHLTWEEESDPRWPSVELAADGQGIVTLLRDAGRA